MNFVAELRHNLALIQAMLQAWVVKTIEDNRPMWLDDGTPVGRGNTINYSGTVTKVGDQINLSGGSSTSAHDIEGASHTADGLTSGDVLTATGDTTFGFGPITEGMLPDAVALESDITTAITTHEAGVNPHNIYILKAAYDAAGDILIGYGDNSYVRLPRGTNDQVLMIDTVSPYIKWALPKFVTYISFGSMPVSGQPCPT